MSTPTQTTTEIPENLTQQQAVGLLVQGVQMAQSRGAYNLNEAELIAKAIRAFAPPASETTDATPAIPVIPAIPAEQLTSQ